MARGKGGGRGEDATVAVMRFVYCIRKINRLSS